MEPLKQFVLLEPATVEDVDTGGSQNASSPSSKSWSVLGVVDGTTIHRKLSLPRPRALSFDNRYTAEDIVLAVL